MDSRKRILLVDDDTLLCNTLTDAFYEAGFHVETANNGEAALERSSGELKDKIDLMILDWKMPGLSGLDVLKRVRENGIDVPVVFLTGLTEPLYEESALQFGAVDFVDKSRSFNILLKRVELVFNSAIAPSMAPPSISEEEKNHPDTLTIGLLEMTWKSHRVLWNGEKVRLTLSEFAIVHYMASRLGQDIPYKDIHELVHGQNFAVGYGPEGFKSNVRTSVKRIRKKFCDVDSGFSMIETYTGFGYRWRAA